MSNAAEIIASRLYQAGVRKAYGIPGGEVLTLIKALDDQGIEFIMSKHENAAGFMAEGSYHASGAPAVLVATVGPGVANAVNFIANAHQDRVPVIFLTGRVDPAEAATYTHQVFDHAAVLRPLTKLSVEITNGAVNELIDKAVSIAQDDPPGPVHVDIPISVAASEQVDRTNKKRVSVSRGKANGNDLEQAKRWLKKAEKPLVIAGVEVLYQQAEKAIAGFCTTHSIPLITTYKAKGVLPEIHPLSLGAAGLSPKANKLLLPFVNEADVIVLAGYDPIEMRSDWRNAWSDTCRVIEFSAQPNSHYMHLADISFVGDIASSLAEISSSLNKTEYWSRGEINNCRQALKNAFAAGDEWGPEKLIEVAREILPENSVITADTGAHRILLSQKWDCYQPRTMLQSTGLCTMGCALPLAIGYKYARPELPVIVFTGDAGLEMVLGELASCRDSGQALIIIVFVDDSLALIELKQRAMKYKNLGVDSVGSTDFVQVAEGFDLDASQIDDETSFRKALHSAVSSSRSTLLACRIRKKAYDGKI